MKASKHTLKKSFSLGLKIYIALELLALPFIIAQAASPTPKIFSDLVFTQSPLVGQVFHDKNADGIKNANEEGIAGVRIVSVTGLVIETDGYGRFHVPDTKENEQHFMLKLDILSLPQNAKLTTENPRVIRISNAGLNKIDFGIQY